MRKILVLLLLVILNSCGRQNNSTSKPVITVSIAPFSFFVKEIAGDDFELNIMVPAGSNPHIYEPFPEQISKLRRSVGYISNGYLGFEMTWLNRFYETNPSMKKLSLSDGIELLAPVHHDDGDHAEAADPHYWVSPKCARKMAISVKDFLIGLKPEMAEKYNRNFEVFYARIDSMDAEAVKLFSAFPGKSFMIYHPNLGYLARDYNLSEVPVEFEGKEPSPARLRQLIDMARSDGIKVIFVQKEYDSKNARAIATDIGGRVEIIDPLAEEWFVSTNSIIKEVYLSLTESLKSAN